MTLDLLEWTGAALSLVGSVMNARGDRRSFLIWIVANVLLAALAVGLKRYGLLTMQLFFTASSLYGWFNWAGNAPVHSQT